MKKQHSAKTNWLTLLSALVAGIFILLAIGSDIEQMYDELAPNEEQLEDGSWESVETYGGENPKITTGMRDSKKRWHGKITIEKWRDYGRAYTEVVNMDHGTRHGWSKTTYHDRWGGKDIVVEKFYILGVEIKDGKPVKKAANDVFPQELLHDKYYWFQALLTGSGFDSLYVGEYLDTFMLMLNEYEFSEEGFADNYEEVEDELGETPRDSIMSFNQLASIYIGFELIKNDEFRLAAIDRNRSGAESTYGIIESDYPNYLSLLEEAGVSPTDFESFSHQADSIMDTYGSLDPEDAYFVDSVDRRLFRAISIISESGESKKKVLRPDVNWSSLQEAKDHFRNVSAALDRYSGQSTRMEPPEVAQVVSLLLIMNFLEADVFRSIIEEAYLKNGGVVCLPLVTTELAGGDGSSAELRGYVVDDGGGEVTDRGIVWAGHYNPSLDDNVEQSGSGSGQFEASLSGLTPGETYYARSYATNSAGTAYGPCMEFIAQSTVGIHPPSGLDQYLQIYPNPASSKAMFDLHLDAQTEVFVRIFDQKGSLAASSFNGTLPAGRTGLEIDVSGLNSGIYHCQVILGNSTRLSGKLVVSD